jgi:protein phosphatase 2C family protein 2/3
MGCGGSKPESGVAPGANGNGGGDDTDVAGAEKVRTFRERRLSMSQMQEQNAPRRRLSVYGTPLDETAQPSEVESPCETCGCKTQGGFEPVPGGSVAKINQDRGLAIYPWADDPKQGLFGVYDGHGRVGEKVSEFVLQNLPPTLLAKKDLLDKDPGNALSDAYIAVDEELSRHVDATVSGTTAVTCLIKENHLWIANAGDSRAIVARKSGNGLKAIDLTIDHKPDSPGEMKRILQMGGHVTPAGANGSPSRVWHNLRGLAMARSIGDHAAATVGVIAEPEITE